MIKNGAPSTADKMGLDPEIGGHDRLVLLCLLRRAFGPTRVADAANAAGLEHEQTLKELEGLGRVGYVDLLHAEEMGQSLGPEDRNRAPYAFLNVRGEAALRVHLAVLRDPESLLVGAGDDEASRRPRGGSSKEGRRALGERD